MCADSVTLRRMLPSNVTSSTPTTASSFQRNNVDNFSTMTPTTTASDQQTAEAAPTTTQMKRKVRVFFAVNLVNVIQCQCQS